MKIRELKEKRQGLIDENQLLIDIAEEEEKRDLTEVEAKDFDKRQSQIDELNKQIQEAEAEEKRAEERKAKMAEYKQRRAVGIHRDPEEQEKNEVKSFRFTKFIKDVVDAKQGRALTGFSAEMHQEAEKEAREHGGELEGHGIPEIVLRANTFEKLEKRDSTATTAGEGGNTIATELSTNWIDALRNNIMFVQAGANFMSGLKGDVAIPRQTALPSFTWSTENATATETNVTWDQVTLSPNRLNGFIDVSKQLITQSSLDVERILVNEMVQGAARAFDDAGMNGTGASNQPTGILNLAGTSDVPHGANGGAPTWALTVEYETDIANANALMGNMAFITNSKVRGKYKTVEKASGTGLFLWDDRTPSGPINGYPVIVSNAVPSDLVKGASGAVCSAMVLGNWSDMLIATWGGLDLLINPYTKGKEALIEIIVNMYGDLAYRHAESFALSEDILTT
jgi:HK97 family phage major capsid protein